MPNRFVRLPAFVAIGLLVGAACGGSSSGASEKPTKVEIAVEAPWAKFAGDPISGQLYGFQEVIKLANAAGGVHGTPIQGLVWDDNFDPATAATVQAQGLDDPYFLGLIGPSNSVTSLGTMQTLQAHSISFISWFATNPKVTDSGYSVAHRVCSRDDTEAPASARFMVSKGAKRIEVLASRQDQTQGLADALVGWLKTNAPDVVVQRDTVQNGQSDYSTIITKIKAFNPDWIYFSADDNVEVPPLATQLRQAGFTIGKNLNWMGSDGQFDPALITKSQGAWEGAYVPNVFPDPTSVPSAQSMVAHMKADYGADFIDTKAGPWWGAVAEATQILIQAIQRSPVKNGKISREDVLYHLNHDTFDTLFGPVKFDSKGDVAGAGVYMFQAKGSVMSYLGPISLS
jgi:branched-chain amino acid transport system substrate-binding protein